MSASAGEMVKEQAFSRFLAGVFTRVAVPVAIVSLDGRFMMANPAFHHLLGFNTSDLQSTRFEQLAAPEFTGALCAARDRQMRDGERYDLTVETTPRGGGRVPVRLTSLVFGQGDQRCCVVTLVLMEAAGHPVLARTPPPRSAGELRAVSLAAFRQTFGENWERIAHRAMLKAEQILRRRLAPGDVLTRGDEHSFVIWFDSADAERNAAVLSGAVKEVRLRFLADFGEEVASHVSAVLVPAKDGSNAGGRCAVPMPTRSVFDGMMEARRTARSIAT